MQSAHTGRTAGRWTGQHYRRHDPRAVAAALLVLALWSPRLAAQSSLLEARILSGEGQVCPPGSRFPRPLIIEVTDETGSGVAGALISFRLPDNGVSATFRNGLKSEILTTDQAGRATLHGLAAGGFAGRFQIRLTVAKGEARAGAVSNQFIAPGAPRGRGVGSTLATLRPHGRLLEIGGLVAAIAAAGLAKEALSRSGSTTVQLPPTIGPPSVTVGHP